MIYIHTYNKYICVNVCVCVCIYIEREIEKYVCIELEKATK